MNTCQIETCGRNPEGGDGYAGFCPSCADWLEEREFWETTSAQDRAELIDELTERCDVHASYVVESFGAGESMRARCECGWISESSTTAGMAGAAWDAHRNEKKGAR